MRTEDELLAILERHVSGALVAIREIRQIRAKWIWRELRTSGALATVRSLRTFLKKERGAAQKSAAEKEKAGGRK